MLSEHADALSSALSAPDRDSDAARSREAYRSPRPVAELLERLQWRTNPAGRLRIDAERELPIALAAVRPAGRHASGRLSASALPQSRYTLLYLLA